MSSLARSVSRQPRQKMVHGLVAKHALEIAQNAYEVLALGSNAWYAQNRNPNEFVRKWWPHFVKVAREQMVDLMVAPNTPQETRDEIEDALYKDGALNPPVLHAEEAVGLHTSIKALQEARSKLH